MKGQLSGRGFSAPYKRQQEVSLFNFGIKIRPIAIIACCRVSIKKKIPFRGQYCLGSMSVSQMYWGLWVYLCQSNMLDFVGVCPSV